MKLVIISVAFVLFIAFVLFVGVNRANAEGNEAHTNLEIIYVSSDTGGVTFLTE